MKTFENLQNAGNRGEPDWFMQACDDSWKLSVDQPIYKESVVEKLGMQDSNPSETPAETNFLSLKKELRMRL